MKRFGFEEFARLLERGGEGHEHCWHYTRWGGFKGIVTPHEVLDAHGRSVGKRRLLLLSRAGASNDKTEQGWGQGVYSASFSYSPYEDVAMWLHYGRRSADAVRVRFDGAALRGGVEEARRDGEFCAAWSAGEGEFEFRRMKVGDVREAKFVDVGYVIPERLRKLNRLAGGNVEYGREFYEVERDGGLGWSEEVYGGNVERLGAAFAPYFKKRGWCYERETRLVVWLAEGAALPQRIAAGVGEQFGGGWTPEECLTSGPWFKAGEGSATGKVAVGDFGAVGLEDAQGSDYAAEIGLFDDGKAAGGSDDVGADGKQGEAWKELEAIADGLRKGAKTINYHAKAGDFAPNAAKIAECEAAMRRLEAFMAEVGKANGSDGSWERRAEELRRRAGEIEASRESGWRMEVGRV